MAKIHSQELGKIWDENLIVDFLELLCYHPDIMPPYQNFDPNLQDYMKFIRLEGDIFVGRPYLRDGHVKIAELDGLEERIKQLRSTNPDQIDAGYLNVFPDELDIYKDSEMLKLPVRGHEEEARRITVEAFTQQTSGRNVRESKF
ncbi:MAG TPA: hypothetical protein VMR59_03230 [Patescibacteria group bacterium]|nr:hypothetical protein [Patescibacteria group bacterium]